MGAIRALVIDDSGIMRKMVMRALTESDLAEFTFTEAGDGLAGLEKFDADQPDIVFVDWNMPNLSGIDFVREIRKTETGHVPIVMVTSEKTMGKVEEALDSAGADNYIGKPFTPEVLQKKLAPLFQEMRDASRAKARPGAEAAGGFFGKLAAKLSD